jgi:CBS-domain-containing membrane protein
LQTVVAAFASDPGARLVFVTDADDHLLGAVTERRLDADLVRQVLPQPLWPALGELDTRDLMRAAQGKVPTAGALMTLCISASPEGSLGDAAITMIRESQPVLALVDDAQRLLGYVSLFEILTDLLRETHP